MVSEGRPNTSTTLEICITWKTVETCFTISIWWTILSHLQTTQHKTLIIKIKIKIRSEQAIETLHCPFEQANETVTIASRSEQVARNGRIFWLLSMEIDWCFDDEIKWEWLCFVYAINVLIGDWSFIGTQIVNFLINWQEWRQIMKSGIS